MGTSVSVWVAEEKDAEKEGVIRLGLELGGKVYPEDRNKRQIFEIPFPPSGALPSELEAEGVAGDNSSGLPLLKELKFEFDKSSDQYGRITLYSVEILECKAVCTLQCDDQEMNHVHGYEAKSCIFTPIRYCTRRLSDMSFFHPTGYNPLHFRHISLSLIAIIPCATLLLHGLWRTSKTKNR